MSNSFSESSSKQAWWLRFARIPMLTLVLVATLIIIRVPLTRARPATAAVDSTQVQRRYATDSDAVNVVSDPLAASVPNSPASVAATEPETEAHVVSDPIDDASEEPAIETEHEEGHEEEHEVAADVATPDEGHLVQTDILPLDPPGRTAQRRSRCKSSSGRAADRDDGYFEMGHLGLRLEPRHNG